MNIRASLLFLIGLVTSAHADLGTPADAVRSLILSAHAGECHSIEIETLKKKNGDPWTEDSLLRLLSKIDPKKIEFRAHNKEANLYWHLIEPQKWLVTLSEPKEIEFKVAFIKDNKIGCGGYFQIIEITPKADQGGVDNG